MRIFKQLNPTAILLYVLVFLLPFQTRWIFVDSAIPFQQMSIYSFDIIILILLEITIITLIKKSWYKQDSATLTSAQWIIIFGHALIIIALFSTAWAPNEPLALYNAIRLLIGVSLLWIIPRIKFKWNILFTIFTASLLIQAGMGIFQFILQDSLIVSKWLGSAMQEASVPGTSIIQTIDGRWLRAHGTQSHPNIFGGFMVIGAIVVSHLINRYATYNIFSYKRLLAIISLILFVTALVFSWSRSAWIAFLIAGFITIMIPVYEEIKAWLIPRRIGEIFELTHTRFYEIRSKIFKTLLSLLVIILMGIIYFPLVQTRFQTQTRLEQLGVTQRLNGFSYTAEILKENYASGGGIGNFTTILQNAHPELALYEIQPVHNVYALITSELGIGALLLITSIIIIAILHRSTTIGPLTVTHRHITLITALIALLIISDFDHYVWTYPSMQYLFWLLIALIIHPKTDNML